MPIEIIPFSAELLPQAGVLLAQRHQRDRAHLSMLPARFAELDVASQAIEAALQRKYADGFAAVADGQLVAYLIGDRETDWRSTNLLASRFWPRRGFHPMAYRLVRRLDPRIAWANGTIPG